MNYHFIAIGGAVMHNLALELLAHGHTITGSDDEIFDPAKTRLQNAGILPAETGWFPPKVHAGLDGVILGMHARADNPELLCAKELGLSIYSFPEFIYEHSKNKTRVVIGGSHGKTTSTAMLMHVLQECGLDFDYLVGSQLEGFERMVKISNAPLIIIEGDEYLTSALHPVPKFHIYRPHHAMITGIAWDHINVFPTFENYVDQFRIFIDTLEPNASLYWFEKDEELQKMMHGSKILEKPYQEPDFLVTETGVDVFVGGNTYSLLIFGRHNLQNAAGVQLLAADLGISEDAFWTVMQSFAGTSRRLEKVVNTTPMVVFRDFAHAPSKVKASVQAVREQYPNHYFVAVFELHTFSSLRADFLPAYAHTLDPADAAFLLFDPHVYALKKMPLPEASILEKTVGHCRAFSTASELKSAVQKNIEGKEKIVLLLMSSGNLGGLTMTDFIF